MFDTFHSRLNLQGELETLTAFRIGAGRSTSPVSADLPVVRDAANLPYIPGSSFKGVLRSYVESVMRSLSAETRIVCNPTDNQMQCITSNQMQNLRQERDNHRWDSARFSEEILERTCWVCQVFGSPWYASKLHIRDLPVQPALWFGQYQQRDGVAIDRDTETAANQKLYGYEVVPAGIRFDFRAVVDNAESWQLGLLYTGLAAFENNRLTLGGGSSRGLGLVHLSLASECYIDKQHLMKHLTAGYEGEEAARQAWLQAFHAKIEQQLETR